jgi:catechol 2,3-dioxygenase
VLYHDAFRYPSRAALARTLRRLQNHGVELSAAHDHGLNEALYLNDPEGSGIELYWDRAPSFGPVPPTAA